MKKYRIKQIAEDIFIPQVKNSFFGHWYGISRNTNHIYLWFKEEFQNEHCKCKSLSEALEVINDHKISFKTIDKTKYLFIIKLNNNK